MPIVSATLEQQDETPRSLACPDGVSLSLSATGAQYVSVAHRAKGAALTVVSARRAGKSHGRKNAPPGAIKAR
jgi:hypothetical protein